MKYLAPMIAALFVCGSANAAVFHFDVSDGSTFSVTVDDAALAADRCSWFCPVTGGPLDGAGVRYYPDGEQVFYSYSGPAYLVIEVLDYDLEGFVDVALVGVMEFNSYHNASLLDAMRAGGTIEIHPYVPAQLAYYLDVYCMEQGIAPANCWPSGNYDVSETFTLSHVEGLPTPIPAAGLFLVTGLVGGAALRRKSS